MVGDIAKSHNQMMGADQPPDELAPAMIVHEMEKDGFAEKMTDYQEGPATLLRPKLGEAAKAEFTASSSFGSPLHGYRATILTNNYRYRVVCECAESDWKTLKPAFDRVIDSFAKGVPKR